jgi:hypothetical protein
VKKSVNGTPVNLISGRCLLSAVSMIDLSGFIKKDRSWLVTLTFIACPEWALLNKGAY